MSEYEIVHLYADIGIEDEVLATYGDVVRVGIKPKPNPFSEVVKGDARQPPLSSGFDLAVAHPPCQRWSVATPGGGVDPESHPDYIDDARDVCQELAEHWIIENVPQAPLRDPVVLTGRHFAKPVKYARAFETSFSVAPPAGRSSFNPDDGPLGSLRSEGNAWVGDTDGWRLSKGYSHDWPGRDLKRHAVPRPYLEHLLYHWLAAVEDGGSSVQCSLAGDGGGWNE